MKKWVKVALVCLSLLLFLVGGFFIGLKVRSNNPLIRAVTPMDKLKATLQMIS